MGTVFCSSEYSSPAAPDSPDTQNDSRDNAIKDGRMPERIFFFILNNPFRMQKSDYIPAKCMYFLSSVLYGYISA